MTGREDELAWHDQVLDEKEQELNGLEEILVEHARRPKRNCEAITNITPESR
jgi:hypothetical protein